LNAPSAVGTSPFSSITSFSPPNSSLTVGSSTTSVVEPAVPTADVGRGAVSPPWCRARSDHTTRTDRQVPTRTVELRPGTGNLNRYCGGYVSVGRPIGMRVFPATVVAVLLVLTAGCGGTPGAGTGSGPEDSPGVGATVTPAPVPTATPAPTATPTPLPPGVGPDVVDADRLATTTAGLDGEYAFTFDRLESRPEFSLGTVYVGPRLRAEVGASGYTLSRLVHNARGGGLELSTFRNATYVGPDRVVEYDGNRTRTRERRAADTGVPAALLVGYVRTYLAVGNVTVERLGDGSVRLLGDAPTRVDAADYSVRARVSPAGVVRSFSAVYSRGDRVRFAELRLDRESSFAVPAWARHDGPTPGDGAGREPPADD
jgi:hypothetical protein